jgi:oxygen-independent coproporphyrinogen III oxidase
MNPPLALYVHIPFCAVRCHYCDFNTYAGLERLYAPFTDALVAEIEWAGAARGRPVVRTIFVGGGTPTVLPPVQLARLLDACRAAFDVLPGAEVTSEANPGTADGAHFVALRAMGVNRLSMGVQSFDDAELQWLGRIHGADEAAAAYHAARVAGFSNINLDFMFGLPGQSPATWAATLGRAVALRPEHLSLYSLTVEHGTPLATEVRRGLAPAPDDDLAADLYSMAADTLAAAGYVHYEISNWALDEREPLNTRSTRKEESIQDSVYSVSSVVDVVPATFACRHNLVYWRHEPYLGFGPGAHSFEEDRRWWNVRPVPQYIERMGAGASPERDGETLDRRTAMGEMLMLGLRLLDEGVTDARFRARFGVELAEAFGPQIESLSGRGLLARLPDRVRLTPQGRLLGNQVFAEFF